MLMLQDKKIIYPETTGYANGVYALSVLSGTIVGVGLFSLPYIASKVGFWVILGYFFVLGTLAIVIHLLFSELSLKTPDFMRLPGFAQFYLGNWGRNTALISTILGLSGTLLAYLIVGGEFLTMLLSPILGGNLFLYTLLYFSLGAVLIYFGIHAIAKIEFWGMVLFFLTLIAIFFSGFPLIKLGNLFPKSGAMPKGTKDLFLPYGPILFSLWGLALIPEIEEMLGKQKHLIKKIIPVAILIPIFIYLFFILVILGITGQETSITAIGGLRNFLGNGVVNFALFFGFLATFTSFITLGLTLKKIFWYDLKLRKNLAWFITCFIPLTLFLVGLRNFIQVIGVVGGMMLGIDGILIALMYQKLKNRKYWFLVIPLILIFALGIIYEIIYFLC